MFKLDNDFLTSLGLGGLPVEEKNRLLKMIYERLEMNVGMRLAEKMSDQQLDEFESFIDGNIDYARNFLNTNAPGWEQSEEFQKSLSNARTNAEKQGRQLNENAVISEFAALKWLSTNFPNYKDVVAEELEKLKGEVSGAVPQILASAQANAQNPQQMTSGMAPGTPMPQTQPQQAYQQPMQPQYQQPSPQPSFQQPYSQPGYGQPAQPYAQPSQPMQPQYPQPAPQQPAAPTQNTQQPYQQPMQPQQGSQAPEPQPSQPQQFTPPPPGYIPGQ